MVELKTMVVVLGLLAVLGGIYYYFQPGGAQPGGPMKNGTVILLKAVEAAAKVNTYVLTSGTSIGGAEPIVSRVVAKGASARVDINDSNGVLRSMYFLPEGNYICLPERGVCAAVEKNTTSSKLRNIMGYAKGQVVEINETAVGGWVTKRVLEVVPGVKERQVAGRRCEEITYLVHLDLLSTAEIEASGYGASVAAFVRREVTECLDTEVGFALYKKLNETLLGESQVIELRVSEFDPKAVVKESEFALTGTRVTEQQYLAADAAEIERKNCMLLPLEFDRTECFELRAVQNGDAAYCDFIETSRGRDLCYLLLLPEWKDAAQCEALALLKDDCYYGAALQFGNATLCGMVGGVERHALCGVVLEGSAAACLPLALADECAATLAGRLGDINICKQIKNETARNDCVGGQ